MKPSYIAVAILAIFLPLGGFVVGTMVSSETTLVPLARQEQTRAMPPEPPPESLSMPGEDVEGEDLEDLPRYPGSVRIEYVKEKQGQVVWTELEYLTDANLEQTREYYRDSFRSGSWEVNDIGFAQSSWVFFVVKDSREVFVEIRPRGGIIEVDIEQTVPMSEPTEESTPDQEAPQQEAPQQEAPQQQVVTDDDDAYEYEEDDLYDDDAYEDDDYEGDN